eukprot:COSAG01_NODE_64857_length_275_cov_0.585227_1_plen_27_part_01
MLAIVFLSGTGSAAGEPLAPPDTASGS